MCGMNIKNLKLSFGVSLALLAMGSYFIISDIAVPIVVRVLGYGETVKGLILMIANGLPLIFVPLAAKMSDKCKSKHGRRTPFIFCGLVLCAASLIGAAFAAKYAHNIWLFAALITMSSIAMAVYHPAAHSLMPDVIPPSSRGAANSVANVVIGAGNFGTLALIMIFGDNYFWIYVIISVIILLSFLIFRIVINEPKLVANNEFSKSNFNIDDNGPTGIKYLKTLDKSEKINLLLILGTIFICNFGYTAMSVTIQNYAVIVWKMTDNLAALLTISMGVGGVIAILLTPYIANKLSNRLSMLISAIFMLAGFLMVFKIDCYTPWLFFMFAVFGGGWSGFCIAALPTVLNFSDIRNNGMFTSMLMVTGGLPKAVTVMTSSIMVQSLGYQSLFPYVMICIGIGIFLLITALLQRPKEVSYKI